MRTDSSLGHVVVLGGSVAGLLAAHVFARHAERVTVLERDHYGGGPEPRVGVPQSRHTHVLLASGLQALNSLLPGLTADLTDAGAPFLSVPSDLGVWQAGQWISRSHPSAPVVTASRPLLEYLIRRRVLANQAIQVQTSAEATGLLGAPERITGVVVRDRAAGRRQRDVTADLVVDATGRGSKTPEWLAALGAGPIAEETLETGRAYATGVFHADAPGDLKGFYIVPDAKQPFGTIILPAENSRWMVTLSGPRGQEPSTDPDAFVDFARGLPHQAPYEWLKAAQPISRPVGYRHTGNRRRRYDRAHLGLLVVGDALCTFNPVYGQGMSVAALNAVALSEGLAAGRSIPSLQRALSRSSSGAWDVATGADSPMPGAEGSALRTGLLDRVVERYVQRVHERVPGDPVVCTAFRDVLFLLAPPSSLLTSPRVLGRTLFQPVRPSTVDVKTEVRSS